MNKIIFIIFALLTFFVIFYFINDDSTGVVTKKTDTMKTIENIEIKDGVQYITITAKGGYSPKISNAKANIPTKLIIKTNGTFDCSSSLIIRSVNYRNILPNTGEAVIDVGTPKSKDTLRGVCSMGMYNFLINF